MDLIVLSYFINHSLCQELEGVDKYDGPWQGNLFIKWFAFYFLGGCGQMRWALGGGKRFIKWVYHPFPEEVCANTMGFGR